MFLLDVGTAYAQWGKCVSKQLPAFVIPNAGFRSEESCILSLKNALHLPRTVFFNTRFFPKNRDRSPRKASVSE